MNRAEAKALVAALVAAYPSVKVEQATVELYTGQIEKLQNTEAAVAALEALILRYDWFPSLAAFREEYGLQAKRIHDERHPPALESGKPPVEENLARVRELRDAMGWS